MYKMYRNRDRDQIEWKLSQTMHILHLDFACFYICFYSLRCCCTKTQPTFNWRNGFSSFFFSSFFCFPKAVKNPVSKMLFSVYCAGFNHYSFRLLQRHLCARILILHRKMIKTSTPYSKIGWRVKRNQAISFEFFFVRLLFADIQYNRNFNDHNLECIKNGLKQQSVCFLWWN